MGAGVNVQQLLIMSWSPKHPRNKKPSNPKPILSSNTLQPLPSRLPNILPSSTTSKTIQVSFSPSNASSSFPRRRLTSEYNKWYIEPHLRYLHKQQNPKNNLKAYADQQYVYNNLHNERFWDWEHPFEKKNRASLQDGQVFTKGADEVRKNKMSVRVLEDFRKELEKNRVRLPLIVQEVLGRRQQ